MGQHLVVHLPLVADARARLLVGAPRRAQRRAGEHLVDVVDQLGEGSDLRSRRLGQLDAEVGADGARDCGPAR